MLSAVSTDFATEKVTANGTAASIIGGNTMHNRTSVSSVSLSTVAFTANDNAVDLTKNPSSVAIVNGVEGDFVIPQCVNLASLKEDFDDANSHWFLSSEVSYLLLVVELIILFIDDFDTPSKSY